MSQVSRRTILCLVCSTSNEFEATTRKTRKMRVDGVLSGYRQAPCRRIVRRSARGKPCEHGSLIASQRCRSPNEFGKRVPLVRAGNISSSITSQAHNVPIRCAAPPAGPSRPAPGALITGTETCPCLSSYATPRASPAASSKHVCGLACSATSPPQCDELSYHGLYTAQHTRHVLFPALSDTLIRSCASRLPPPLSLLTSSSPAPQKS